MKYGYIAIKCGRMEKTAEEGCSITVLI